jgi:hypothetical protein
MREKRQEPDMFYNMFYIYIRTFLSGANSKGVYQN